MVTHLAVPAYMAPKGALLLLTVFAVCSCTRCAPVQKTATQAHQQKAAATVSNVAPEHQQSGDVVACQAPDGATAADAHAVNNAVASFAAGLAANHPLRKSVVYWSAADWLRMKEQLRDPSDQLKRAFLDCVSQAFGNVDPLSIADAFSTIASNLLDVADATHDKAFANALISHASSIEQFRGDYSRAHDLAQRVIERAALGEPCDPFVLMFCRNKVTLTSAQQGLYEQAERELREWHAASPSPSDRERFIMAYAEANMYLCLEAGEKQPSQARIKQGYAVLKRMIEAPYMSESQKTMVQHSVKNIEQFHPYVLDP